MVQAIPHRLLLLMELVVLLSGCAGYHNNDARTLKDFLASRQVVPDIEQVTFPFF